MLQITIGNSSAYMISYFLNSTEFFFLSMVIIVGASVIATIFVIHMSATSHRPPPDWIRWLVLQKLPRMVCLDGIKDSRYRKIAPKSPGVKNTNENGVDVISKSNNKDVDVDVALRPENCDKNEVDVKQNQHEWKLVSLVVDRYLMVIFTAATVVITCSLFILIVIGSKNEYDNEIDILYNSWQQDTKRIL